MATPYATTTDLTKFGLSAAALNTASTDPTVQQAHLDAAGDLVDSYLQTHFKLPLTSFGVSITQKVCEIAAYTLINIRGYDPDLPGDRTIHERYEAALDWLKGIAQGDVTPVVVDASGGESQGGPNTLQMNTQGSTQGSVGGALTLQTDPSNGLTSVTGRPRQRGWR